jgi:chemotaxis protein CheY-P-specific phosphatase CheC
MLARVFTDVLETLAFMFTDLAEGDDLPDPAEEQVLAEMSFTGVYTGDLALAVPRPMCAELAGNILGCDPNDMEDEAPAFDAFKEVLNVTCGHVLTDLAGAEPVFDLTVPEVRMIDAAEWETLRDAPETVTLLVDDYPVLLRLSLQEN